MKKKIISLLLAACMLVGLLPVAQLEAGAASTEDDLYTNTVAADGLIASGTCGDNLYWFLSTDGALTITGTGAMDDHRDYSIPWYPYRDSIKSVDINEGVTTVGESAFLYCSNLNRVTFPSSITYICTGAFYKCTSLHSISISGADIGDSAFEGCSSLANVKISNIPNFVSAYAFADCSNLTNIEMSGKALTIGGGAFQNCTNLSTIVIPGSITSINSSAFKNCSALASITLPKSISKIWDRVFDGCSGLKDVYYTGNSNDWNKIKVGSYNDSLLKASKHYNASPFIDVQNTNDYFYTPVLWAVENNITYGTDDTHFSPNQSCTRSQVVAFLWRAMGSPVPTTTECPFVDVKSSDYFYSAILWAVENGITYGTDDTHFSPNATVTRADFVTFLWRAEKRPSYDAQGTFVDIPADSYYAGAVLWAAENKVAYGVDDTHFAPAQFCTRGQVVSFLYRDLA